MDASTRTWVSGDEALIKDASGRESIDGLSGLGSRPCQWLLTAALYGFAFARVVT